MTKLEIINLSLLHLGQSAITQTQLTDNVIPSAIVANVFWEPCRDEVLGESNWSFATVTHTLSSLDIEDSEWAKCYSYPTLSVSNMWFVFNTFTYDKKSEQEFTRRHIVTLGVSVIFSDLENAIAEYTYKVTDTLLWDNKFNMAMSYRLASSMALPLGADVDKGLKLLSIANTILGEAKRLNSSEKTRVPDQPQRYIDAQ